jgi:hypothetical protein
MTASAYPISASGARWTQLLRLLAIAVAILALCVAAFVAGRLTKATATRHVTTVVQPTSNADPLGPGCVSVMPRARCI